MLINNLPPNFLDLLAAERGMQRALKEGDVAEFEKFAREALKSQKKGEGQ
jgi:hypothetical protein